jgi:hypothetical protein
MPVVPGIIYVAPPTVYSPPPIDVGRVFYTVWWEAWDGSNWSLSDDSSGIVLMRDVRGLGNITIEHHRDEHESLAGSRWRDFRALNREIYLPIRLFSDGTSEDWVEHNRAFWKTMRAGKTGWLHIIHPNGEHRRIKARYDKGGEEAMLIDPAFFGWANYGIYMTAEQPYWEAAEPIGDTWGSPEPVYFFGGGASPGNAPPFGITDEKDVSTATITNPGDVEAWPKWIYRGPATSASVGVAGEVVEIPIELLEGESITLDLNPYEQSAIRENGTDVTDDLGTFDFSPIPAGEEVALDVTLVGTGGGSIELQLTPLFEWGIS